MALTKVTQGVINPNENYQAGIITATGAISSGSSITATGDITSTGAISSGSSVTATKFYGDASALTGVSGFGNAVSTNAASGGTEIFKVPDTLNIGAGNSVTVQSDSASGWQMFTRARDVVVAVGATLHIASSSSNGSVGSGTTFKTNIMGLSQGLF